MNLRVFKKDIDFLTEDFLSDALISMGFAREESKREKILDIINEAIDLRAEECLGVWLESFLKFFFRCVDVHEGTFDAELLHGYGKEVESTAIDG